MSFKSVRVLLVGLATLFLGAAARAATFDVVAVHPEVATQPTWTGDRIVTLKPFNGKLYAGYGDYGANTGPIEIRAFDPSLGTFTDSYLSSFTEAIYIYRELDGKLYAPNIDTRGGGAGYAVGTAGSPDTWQDVIPVDGIHMFDMNKLGNDLFMGGASGDDGVVWRSTDGGQTWTESLRVTPTKGNDFVRIMGTGVLNGKLYADVEQHYFDANGNGPFVTDGAKAGHAMVFDGTSWSTGPILTKDYGFMSHPEEFAGSLVYLNWQSGLGTTDLFAFNGKQVKSAYTVKGPTGDSQNNFWDYTIDNGVLYGLQPDGDILETTDLKNWSLLATAPTDSCSIGILDGTLYLGAAGGLLYRYSDPVAPASLSDGGMTFAAVPEPSTLVLGLVAIAGAMSLLARRSRAAI